MTEKPNGFAVTFGRFNLLHNGHVKLFEDMAELAEEVVIGISSSDSNLPLEDRKRVIERATQHIARKVPVTIVEGRQPFEVFEKYNGYEVISFFGEDQAALGAATERVYQWTTCAIPRLTSSSALRTHIDNEEWDILSTLVPPEIVSDVINLRYQERND